MATTAEQIVIFKLDGGVYAVDLTTVVRVVRMVEVRPLPKAPTIVLGVVDVEGELTAVLDIRQRFRLRKKTISVNDKLILARTRDRHVAFVVDEVMGCEKISNEEIVPAEKIVPGLEHLRGIVRVDTLDGLIMIHDLTTFLSNDEAENLAQALPAFPSR